MSRARDRDALGRHLSGSGIEVGPGHVPFAVRPGVHVSYVDRLTAARHHELFPEVPRDSPFCEPDVVADLDADKLAPIESGSQDFVICSHVLEHLSDPLGFLDDAHRVLRVGGVLLLLLPDRRYTFDRARAPTPLACLVRDHEAGATVPDDAHVLEFLRDADQGPDFRLPDDPAERAELYAWHRARSIHVHCWNDREFREVLRYCTRDLHHGWRRVDHLAAEDTGIEFGYVLARTDGRRPRLGERLRRS